MSHDEGMTSRGRRGVTITARLSLVLLAVVAFAVALTGAIGLYVFDESVRQREAREVDVAKHTFAIGLESAAQRNLALASTIASLEPVRSAMQRRDRLALLEFMRPLYETLQRDHGVDNTHFHTERLITVLRMHKPEQFGDDLSSFRKILVEVNETRTVRSGLEQGANGLPIRGVVPVFAPDGAHVGSVEVGAFLKSPMLRRLAPRGVDYTVVLQNKEGMAVYASSIEQPTRILSDAEIASGAPARRRSIASLSGDSYLVAADPLLDYAGRKIGVVEVIVDVSPIEAPLSSLRRSLVMGLAVALLVGFGAALVVGRRLSSPIRDLSETARSLALRRLDLTVPQRERPDEIGEMARALAVFQADAVALQSAEHQVREAREELQRVLDHAPVAVVLTDGSARVTYWNAEARKVFAIAGPEVLGEPVERILGAEVVVGPERGEVTVSVSGVERRLLVVRSSLPGEGDGAVRGVFFAMDVTDARVAEEHLHEAQRLESLGQLTGGVAHDFNNLLFVVLGSLELLATRLDADPDSLDLVTEAIEAGRRGVTLTRSLLAYARRQPLAPATVDVRRLVSELEPLVQRAVGATVDVHVVHAADLWDCLVDAGQLQSALLNLSINARDAMPDGGRLTIETANRVVDGNDVPAGDYVTICVRDSGHGMSAATRARAFEPFFTTKARGKGTGLGLSMVYGFARQSGGEVVLRSKVGEGTEVTLFLPRAMRRAVPAATVHEDARGSVDRLRVHQILVVEDDVSVRALTRELLRAAGFAVLEADSAQAALDVLAAHPGVALVLSDVVMPGPMRARDMLEAIQRTRPGLPMIFMSGYAEGLLSGKNDLPAGITLLEKPVARDKLIASVSAALAPANPQRRSQS